MNKLTTLLLYVVIYLTTSNYIYAFDYNNEKALIPKWLQNNYTKTILNSEINKNISDAVVENIFWNIFNGFNSFNSKWNPNYKTINSEDSERDKLYVLMESEDIMRDDELNTWGNDKSDGIESSHLSNIITEEQEVIWNYYWWWVKRNIYSLPKWKYTIMDEEWMPDSQKLHYHIINSLECGREDGFCDWSDIWPFQINYSANTDAHKDSKKLLDLWNRENLYRYQLKWTLSRLEWYKERICLKHWSKEDDIFWCMLRIHNGNNSPVGWWILFKDIYAKKWLEVKKVLLAKILMNNNSLH